jgi:hypothetical protein
MATNLKHSTALRTFKMTTGIKTAFDTTGTIDLYTGSQPATPDAAPTGTLLGTLTMSATAFGTPSSGAMTANTITSGTAVGTGTAGWFRMHLSGDPNTLDTGAGTNRRLDGTVGTSGCDMNFAGGVSFITGGTISETSFVYNEVV